jgi:hypothetical protein
MVIYAIIFIVFGFLLAWVAQMVSREEVSVGLGAGILIITFIAWVFTRALLKDADDQLRTLASTGVLFGVLLLGLTQLARLSLKHAAIISAIYTVLLTLIGLGVTALAK